VARITDRAAARARATYFARKIAEEHGHEIERAKDTGNALAALQPAVERGRKKLRRELGPQLSAQALLDEALEDVVAEAIAKRLAQDVEAEDEKLRPPAPPEPAPPPRGPSAAEKATQAGVNNIRLIGGAMIAAALIGVIIDQASHADARARRALAARVNATYVEGKCLVTDTKVTKGKNRSYHSVQFTLEVNGVTHSSDKYSPNDDSAWSPLGLKRGDTTPCYYDPKNPDSSFLQRGSAEGSDSSGISWFMLGFVAMGLWMVFGARRMERAESD